MNISNFIWFWQPTLEILILWVVIYHIMLFFEGTRALQVLRGMTLLLVAFFLFQRLNLVVLEWLLTKLFGISIIAILVIFHPEIRQGLARLGRRNIFSVPLAGEELDRMLKEIGQAAENLAKEKIGALIAIENNDPLSSYTESGVGIDAKLTSELIQAIFTPNNPLHDGGVVIHRGRVVSAGCLFPLTENQELSRVFGMRHRAALGLSEESDSVIIIVSEERHDISLVFQGRLYRDMSKEELFSKAKELLKLKKENE
ncbi:MAG: diadenylate cyclase CdaA [Candidatus Omnitrophota bacterium]